MTERRGEGTAWRTRGEHSSQRSWVGAEKIPASLTRCEPAVGFGWPSARRHGTSPMGEEEWLLLGLGNLTKKKKKILIKRVR